MSDSPQIFFPYWLWEDYQAGMWRGEYGEAREKYLQDAIKFTGNHKLYGRYMRKVIKEWPYACMVNMTNSSLNKQAWVGHAACCLAIGCPEEITRLAWSHLTQEQQDRANAQADIAIRMWQERYAKGVQLTIKEPGRVILTFGSLLPKVRG